MKWKAAAIVVLLAIGIGTVGIAIMGPGGSSGVQYLTSAVTRTTVARQVVTGGAVRSAATYDLSFGASPVLDTGTPATGSSGSGVWVVQSVQASPGDRVTRGAVLAVADASAASAKLALAKADLASAAARLAVDRAGATPADRMAAHDAILQAGQQLELARQSEAITQRQDALRLAQAQAALQVAQGKLLADRSAGPLAATIAADQAAILQAQQQLDTLTLQNQASSSQATFAAQQAAQQVTQAQQALQAAQAQAALDVSQAQQALQAAQAKLAADQAASPGPSSSTSAADQAAVAAARQQLQAVTLAGQASVAKAQQQLDAATLQMQAASSQSGQASQLDALKLSQAQRALQAAQTKLVADQAAGPPADTIAADQAAIVQAQQQIDSLRVAGQASSQQAAGQLATAGLSLAVAQDSYRTKVAAAPASVLASDASAVASARETARQAQLTLDGATLRSPVDGVVLAVNIVAGAAAPAAADVVVGAGTFQVTASVTETDLPSLAVGQVASVAITALGASASGTVSSILPSGTVSGSAGVVTFPIVVTLGAAPSGTAAGMTALVSVTTAQARNVLAVPSVALAGGPGQYTVRVLDAAGQPHDRAVQVGLITSTLAEIRSGLSDGELVVTGTIAPQTGTSSSGTGLPGLLPAAGSGGGGQQQ